ncbi:MAG: hypothetical protein RR407_08885 [Bacteroidales bacterium]
MIVLKNITKKLLSLIMVLGIVTSFVSCSNDLKDVTYNPENNSITFKEASASYDLTGDAVVVKLQRGVANSAVTVNLTLTDPKGIYKLATPSVTFNEGSYSQDVTLEYDITNLKPAVAYDFTLSFNEADKAISGVAIFKAKASLPLEYHDYGTIAWTSGSWLKRTPSNKTIYKLQLAKYTTNYYRIVGFYGSKTDLEFNIQNNLAVITSPLPSFYNSDDVKDYPLYKFVTAAVHPKYGAATAWVDSNSSYTVWSGLQAGGKIVAGSKFSVDSYYTVDAGYFGWNTDIFTVTAVK